MRTQEIPAARFWGAVLAAPAGAAVAGAAYLAMGVPFDGAPTLFLGALLIGYAIAFLHMLALGLPLFMVLAQRWRLGWWNGALCGGLVGAGPISLLAFPDILPGSVVFCAGCGAAGGLALRAVIGAPVEVP